ncbi:two-component sensor histidine kinase [Palleronia aestuarii]|uniref:histidine kinase n=1 Tax=Palleronia aestuarii TaxID=568105 RepID=A0A2W7NBU2_9RHOB|nr:GAF domain-containing protein [Palleronia aestuarii]PZX14194.1 two-component sensor histidine kinase [Palleronia aestuarii]
MEADHKVGSVDRRIEGDGSHEILAPDLMHAIRQIERLRPEEGDPGGIMGAGRLRVLQDTGLLNDTVEDIFERAVTFARRITGSKVSLFSLVDADRQINKAQEGLKAPPELKRQMPLTHSFCKHVVTSRSTLVIPDARTDPRVQENPSIRDLGIVGYLGVPIAAPGGEVLGALCAIEPEPRDWTDADVQSMQDIAVGIESEIALRLESSIRRELYARVLSEQRRLKTVLESTSDSVFQIDREWIVTYANSRTKDLVKDEPRFVGVDLRDFLKGEGDAFLDAYRTAFRTRKAGAIVSFYAPYDAWYEARYFPIDDGMIIFFRNFSDQKAEETTRLVMFRELHHRIRNNFTLLNGMVSLTARSSTSLAEMRQALLGRIASMARTHELISPDLETSEDRQIPFEAILRAEIEPFDGPEHSRTSLTGAAFSVGPETAKCFSLILHEWATNASKYGAFSSSSGKLEVDWSQTDERLELSWSESGLANIQIPTREGFGSTLTRTIVVSNLDGTLDRNWQGDGLKMIVSMPIDPLIN